MPVELLAIDTPLAELAERVKAEHELVTSSLADALSHAILAGEALLLAHDMIIPNGYDAWNEWTRTTLGKSARMASAYMRIATYRDHIPAGASVTEAHALYLRGFPAIGHAGAQHAIPDGVRQEVLRLDKQHVARREIAKMLGVSRTTVANIVDPAQRRRHKEGVNRAKAKARAAKAALRAKERADLVRAAGGSVARAYSLLRQAISELDAALGEAKPDVRDGLRNALASAHKAEDQIVTALRAERQVS